ncbi:MAG: hypothetical protein H0W12_03895 [Chitinophagaceae bacterium]|nr:hypothetical protein [Chitinophagaceae bacterium]
MERVATLIQKLQQQIEQKASASQMLITVKMLQAELTAAPEKNNASGKVVVIMPNSYAKAKDNDDVVQPSEFAVQELFQPEEKIIEILQVDEKEIEEELEQMKKHAEAKNQMSANAKPALTYDPVEEVPTLTHQTPVTNYTDFKTNSGPVKKEINESLKVSETEVSESLTELPIKDLKKAIGVNDRFLFISELFRGDEAMYERSIKTINNFSILAEAEYWIRRELKVKTGWSDSDPVVKQFDQLIRRRFS